MYITKTNLKKIIKTLAERDGVSEDFVRSEMEKAINSANWNNLNLKHTPSFEQGFNLLVDGITKSI